jgi:hypothetical protein
MSDIITPQELGKIFEKKVHEVVKSTYMTIMDENQIKKKYGRPCYGVDHLIYNEITGQLILIQDKWTKSPQQISTIDHFVLAVETIEKYMSIEKGIKIKAVGIYLTRKGITKGSIERFDEKNSCQSYKKFCHTSSNDMSESIHKLKCMLYIMGFPMYEPEYGSESSPCNSVIMLDDNDY